MDKLILRLEKLIGHLPGPGKLIFGALIADREAFDVLIACLAAVAATSLQPPVLTLYTPEIQQALRDPGSNAPLYVAAGYLLLAVLTLVGGASGDIFGRKRFMLVGLVGVLATNVAGMFLVNSELFVYANVLNTITGALVMPMCVAVVTLAFPAQVRPFAYGALFATQGICLVAASSINGLAVLVNLDWTAFLPAIAAGFYALRIVLRDVQESRAPMGTSRQDLILNVVWASAIFLLVYGVLAFGGGPTDRNVFLVVGICVAGFVVAYRWVSRRMRRREVRLYGARDFALAIMAGIVLSMVQASLFYQIGSYFQKIQEVGPVESGLRIVPFVLAMMIATLIIVRLAMRFGARRLISGGMLIMAVGTAGLYFLRPDTPYWQVFFPLLVMGFGFGIAIPARTVVVLTTPPPGIVGMSAGVNSAAGQSGFALGTILSSVLVTLFANQHFADQLKAANVPKSVIDTLAPIYQNVFARVIAGNLTNLPESVADQVTLRFGEAFSVGLGQAYLVMALITAAAAVVVFIAMSKGLKGTLAEPLPGMPGAKPSAASAPPPEAN